MSENIEKVDNQNQQSGLQNKLEQLLQQKNDKIGIRLRTPKSKGKVISLHANSMNFKSNSDLNLPQSQTNLGKNTSFLNMKYFVQENLKKNLSQSNLNSTNFLKELSNKHIQNPRKSLGALNVTSRQGQQTAQNPMINKRGSEKTLKIKKTNQDFYQLDISQSQSYLPTHTQSHQVQQQQENKYSKNMRTKSSYQMDLLNNSNMISNYYNRSEILNQSSSSLFTQKQKKQTNFMTLHSLKNNLPNKIKNGQSSVKIRQQKSFYSHNSIYNVKDYKTLSTQQSMENSASQVLFTQSTQAQDSARDKKLREDFRMKVVSYLIEMQYSKQGAKTKFDDIPLKNIHKKQKKLDLINNMSVLDKTAEISDSKVMLTLENTADNIKNLENSLDENRFDYPKNIQKDSSTNYVEIICYDMTSGRSLKQTKIKHEKLQTYFLDNIKTFLNSEKVDYDSKIEQAEQEYQVLLEKLKENGFIVKIPVEMKIANQDYNDFYAPDEEYFLKQQRALEALRKKQMYDRMLRHINSRNKSEYLKFDFGIHANTTTSSSSEYESDGSGGPRQKSPMPTPKGLKPYDFDAILNDKKPKGGSPQRKSKVYNAVGGDLIKFKNDNLDSKIDYSDDEMGMSKRPTGTKKKKKKKDKDKISIQELLAKLDRNYEQQDLTELQKKIKRKQKNKKYSLYNEPINLPGTDGSPDLSSLRGPPPIEESEEEDYVTPTKKRVYKAKGGPKMDLLQVDKNNENKNKKKRLSNRNEASQPPSRYVSPNMSQFDIDSDQSDEIVDPKAKKPKYNKPTKKKPADQKVEKGKAHAKKKVNTHHRDKSKDKLSVESGESEDLSPRKKAQTSKYKKKQFKSKANLDMKIEDQAAEQSQNEDSKIDTPQNKRRKPGKAAPKLEKSYNYKSKTKKNIVSEKELREKNQTGSKHTVKSKNTVSQHQQSGDNSEEVSMEFSEEQEDDDEEVQSEENDQVEDIQGENKTKQKSKKKSTLKPGKTISYMNSSKKISSNQTLGMQDSLGPSGQNKEKKRRVIKKKTRKVQRLENGKVIMQRDVLDMLCDLDGIDDFDINRFKESKNYGICAPPMEYEDEGHKKVMVLLLNWEAQVNEETNGFLKELGRESLQFGEIQSPVESSRIASEDDQELILDSEERKLQQEFNSDSDE